MNFKASKGLLTKRASEVPAAIAKGKTDAARKLL